MSWETAGPQPAFLPVGEPQSESTSLVTFHVALRLLRCSFKAVLRDPTVTLVAHRPALVQAKEKRSRNDLNNAAAQKNQVEPEKSLHYTQGDRKNQEKM